MLQQTSYISANANQTPTVADWGKNNLICYGSCNAVFIYDPHFGSGGKVIDTLVSHNDRVNSVRWIRGQDVTSETELVSGSADGNAIVWMMKGVFIPVILKGHQSNVNIVDAVYKKPQKNGTTVFTASMDFTVRLWYREKANDQFIAAQVINFGNSLCVGLKVTLFTKLNIILMACAVDNGKIQLYVEDEDNNKSLMVKESVSLRGHDDWVRGLDFTTDGDLILASSSQDCFIRLWRISSNELYFPPGDSTQENKFIIPTKDARYRATTASVLASHDDWVYSVNWRPNTLQLLSASLDKSMIIWELDTNAKLWVEKVRVGEVGGNTLGFYGGLFGPGGKTMLAHSYHGAFHMWKYNEETSSWEPHVIIGGHFKEVVDLAWDPKGEFVVSVSLDQTTRIHAPWHREGLAPTWHEIARPQIHGYDLSSVALLSRYRFASSAEEKVIRTFEAPRNFVENFRRICKIDEADDDKYEGPEGASVPSLGLSNKAVYGTDNDENIKTAKNVPYPQESHFTSVELHEPPTEETLLQNTLWPEVQKLYGHGYEVYCLSASPDGNILASACKATTKEHAAIHLWDTKEWKKLQELVSHTLTVVQIAFSPDSQHILSVSRDRSWSLFRKKSELLEYDLVASTDKHTGIHTRIIWCCAWSHDSKYFATGSRDGKLVVWGRNKHKEITNCLGEYEAIGNPLEMKSESLTAVAFAPVFLKYTYLMAVGFEAGRIMICSWNTENFSPHLTLVTKQAHHLAVKRLAFRPMLGRAGDKEKDENILQLASCGSDHSVRIYDLFMDKLIYKMPVKVD